jgi:hypothetical protein
VKRRFANLTRRQLLIGAGGMTLASAIPGASLAASDPLVPPLTWDDLAGCPLLDGANPFWVQAAEEIMTEQAALLNASFLRKRESSLLASR